MLGGERRVIHRGYSARSRARFGAHEEENLRRRCAQKTRTTFFQLSSSPAAAAASAAAPSSRSAPSVVEEMDMDAMLQALEELEETRRQK